jgi:hypothetical protein
MLDKIINDVKNAYRIQFTSDDVYMSCGHPVADIETFLISATLVIERVPDTSKSYDMQKGLQVCARHTSFIDLMGWTLLFCVFYLQHNQTQKSVVSPTLSQTHSLELLLSSFLSPFQ